MLQSDFPLVTVQVNPAAGPVQSLKHPAPSHFSVPTTSPSPQIGVHFKGITPTRHLNPASSFLQSLEHPSFETLFPSSHVSPDTNKPSPQIGKQLEVAP